MIDCPRFEGCSAPLCPLDKETINPIWYPDEEVCTRRDTGAQWVRTQRKIAKRIRPEDLEGFFDIPRLEKIKVVKGGVSGRDPDSTKTFTHESN